MATRGVNRLTRDNAGKITGTGDGATARGGRLKTAAGNQRGRVMARIGGGGGKLRGGKGAKAAKQAQMPRPKTQRSGASRVARAVQNYKTSVLKGEMQSSKLLTESNALHGIKNKTKAQQARLAEISTQWRKMRKSDETARKALSVYGIKPGQKGSKVLTRITNADRKAAERALGATRRRRS